MEILASPPPIDQLVVCHGDACSPNTLLTDDGCWSGHVDLDQLGVADRWADLAVATWSTQWNYGPGWEDALLDAYGIAPDAERTRFYRLLWDVGDASRTARGVAGVPRSGQYPPGHDTWSRGRGHEDVWRRSGMERTAVNPWTWSVAFGFNQAELVEGAGKVLFCSGQTSVDADGGPQHPGDMAAQISLAVDNLEAVLADAGMSLANVVRLNYYTTDVDEFLANMAVVGDAHRRRRRRARRHPARRRAPRVSGAHDRARSDRGRVTRRTEGMMTRTLVIEESVRIRRAPEAVWAMVTDYESDHRWRPGITEMTPDPPGTTGGRARGSVRC